MENIDVEVEKFKKYERRLERFPFLIEELEGFCKGADISFETLLKLKLGEFKITEISCTSLFLNSKFMGEKRNSIMKIRDQKPLPQYICKKRNENKTPYFFSSSISDIGYGFFIKENGLFGINNTGSFLKEDFINEYGFDDCDLMRIIVESCDKVEDCLEIIKKLQKEKLVGYTGNKRGMIFLFGDREKAVFVELNSFELNFREIKERIGFTNDFLLPESQNWIEKIENEGTKSSRMRKIHLEEIFNENKELNLEKLREISRDKKYYPYSICRDTKLMPVRTISVFITIFFEIPILWICLGQPYISPYFPFSINGNKILDKFISGEVSIKLNRIFQKKQLNDENFLHRIKDFEKKLDKKFEEIQNVEEKNLKIQKEVYNFIVEAENECLYHT